MDVKLGMSATEIQKIFNSDNFVKFECGTYNITDTIQISSDTIVDLNNATLRRYCSKPVFITKADENTIKYSGATNIVIENGTIEGMNTLGFKPSNLLTLFHADSIYIRDVTFLDTVGSHAIDIVGSRGVSIERCKFMGYCSYNKDFRETIQIDFAYYEGLPYYGKTEKCYDLTHCNDIKIANCLFGPSTNRPAQYTAIGAHAQSNSSYYHSNIFIIDNIAIGNGVKNGNGFFFRMMNMNSVFMRGNTVENYGRFVIFTKPKALYNSDGSSVSTSDITPLHNLDDICICNNKIKSNGYNYAAFGVFIDDSEFRKSKNIFVRELFVPDEYLGTKYVNIKGCYFTSWL